MAEPGRIDVVDETGLHVGSVAPEEANNLPAGVRVATPEQMAQVERDRKYGGLGGQALAAGEGALSSATLGLSTVALDAAGYGDDIRGLREANPMSAMGGQVVGAFAGLGKLKGGLGVAQTALAGPSKMLYRGGAALERGLGGGLLGTGARAALEGGVFGLGDALAESAVYDTELTGERLAASMAQGALFGGGAALGAAGLGKGLSLAARGLKRTGKALSGPASKAFAKSVSAMTGVDEARVLKLIAPTAEGKAARAIVIGGDDAVARHVDDLATAMDDVARHEDEVFSVVRDAELKESAVAKMMDHGGDEAAIAFTQQHIDDAVSVVDDIITNKSIHGGVAETKRLKAALTSMQDDIARGIEEATDSATKKAKLAIGLDKMKREVGRYTRSSVNRANRNGNLQNLTSAEKYRGLYERMRTSLEDTKVWGKFGDAQRRVNAPLSEMLGTNQAYQRGFTSEFGRSKVDPWRKARVADRGKIQGYLTDLKNPRNDLRNRAVTERMASMEDAADAIAEMYGVDASKLKNAAGRTRKTIAEASETASVMNAMKELEGAGGGGVMAGLAGGALASGNPIGLALAPVLNPARTVRQLAAVEQLASRVSNSVDGGVAKLFKRARRQAVLATPRLEQSRDDFAKQSKALRATAEMVGLEDELERSMGELAYGAPTAKTRAVKAQMAALSHLMETMPLAPPDLYGNADAAQVDPWEATQWIERATALADPGAMFAPLDSNDPISLAGVDAVKKVYPAIYDDARSSIRKRHMEGIQDGDLLPRSVRVQLALAFELPELEPMMDPETMARVAAGYETAPEPPQQQSTGGGGLDLASVMNTSRDRMESDYR